METPLRRTWAEIDLDALAHNYAVIQRQVGPDCRLLGVVKADAYGHGAVRVAKKLEQLGAAYLAVSNIEEAEELRDAGISLPVLMLGFTPIDQTERILRLNMTQGVSDLETARLYCNSIKNTGKSMRIHLKLDTGMGRLGFRCDEERFDKSLGEILELLRLPGLEVEGVFTHFAVSDEDDPASQAYTRLQHERFTRMIDAVEGASGFRFRLKHCCNAGGIASYPHWAGDMVRCGIILYGTGPLARRLGMRPVMRLKTTVAVVRELGAGETVSYGRTWTAARPSRLAVLSVGYADGLHRALSNHMQVLTPYGMAPQVGRVCMDMCMIDATDLPELKSGDEVEIFGEHIPCEDLANACGTISYELLCAVSRRVPRHYLEKNGEKCQKGD